MAMMIRVSLALLFGIAVAEELQEYSLQRPKIMRRVAITRDGKLGLDEDMDESDSFTEGDSYLDEKHHDEVELYQRSEERVQAVSGATSGLASSQLPVQIMVPYGSCQTVTCQAGSQCACPPNYVISKIINTANSGVASISCCTQVMAFPTLAQLGYQVPTVAQIQAASGGQVLTNAATAGTASTGANAPAPAASSASTAGASDTATTNSTANSSNSSANGSNDTSNKNDTIRMGGHVVTALLVAIATAALRMM